MNELWGILLAVGAGIAAIAGIAAVVAAFVGSFNKQRTDALRQDNQDLDTRVGRLEHENERLKTQREADRVEREALKKDNKRLEELVTQRAKVDEVLSAVQDHNRKAEAWWSKTSDHNEALEELTLRMIRAVEKLAEGQK